MHQATIGHEHIIFRIFSRNTPETADYFDANWLSAEVMFKNQGFLGQVACNF